MSASFLLDTNKSETNYLDFIYICSDYAKNFNGMFQLVHIIDSFFK